MMDRRSGVTILELLVVLFVVGLLATIAYSVYSSHVYRASIAATAMEISELQMACAQYEVDTGQYPPSSSGTRLAPGPIDPIMNPGEGAMGCGYMLLALKTSLNGNMYAPLSPRWHGPYLEVDIHRLGDINGNPIEEAQGYIIPMTQLLDRWGGPYHYVRGADYAVGNATRVPATSPFASEIYYNPSTIQIVSKGPNGWSSARPGLGTDEDDITNFRY
jgi:prepilin-type N-terminal cleavage/methylation domain-containing protein